MLWQTLCRDLPFFSGTQISVLVTTSINCALQLAGIGPCKAQMILTYSFIMLKIMELDSTIVYNSEN